MEPTLEQILIELTKLSTKLDTSQADISDIKGHVAVINDGAHVTAIQLAALTAKIDIWEKLIWMVVATSIAAVVGAAWAVILHKRGK